MLRKLTSSGVFLSTLLISVVFVLMIVTMANMNTRFTEVENKLHDMELSSQGASAMLPNKFVLPSTSYTPVVSQGARGTCWYVMTCCICNVLLCIVLYMYYVYIIRYVSA